MAFQKSRPWGNVKPPAGSVVDWNDPINQGLNNCWLFNEPGGLQAKDIAKQNHGVLTGGVTRSVGVFGNTLKFDGVNGYVSLPNAVATAAPFSISLWFKVDNVTTYETLVNINLTGADNNYWVLQTRGDVAGDPLEWQINDLGAGETAVRTSTSVTAGVWMHACCVEASSIDHRVYLNAGGAASSTTSRAPAGINNTNIGVYRGTVFDGYFNGSIDNVRIYNRAISLSEINRLYTEPFAGIVTPKLRIGRSAGAPATNTSNLLLMGVG